MELPLRRTSTWLPSFDSRGKSIYSNSRRKWNLCGNRWLLPSASRSTVRQRAFVHDPESCRDYSAGNEKWRRQLNEIHSWRLADGRENSIQPSGAAIVAHTEERGKISAALPALRNHSRVSNRVHPVTCSLALHSWPDNPNTHSESHSPQ